MTISDSQILLQFITKFLKFQENYDKQKKKIDFKSAVNKI